jgi:hypothetical protein
MVPWDDRYTAIIVAVRLIELNFRLQRQIAG